MDETESRQRRIGILTGTLLLFVRIYQALLSPWLGGHCRFYPSCSNYAVEALQTHGWWRGGRLVLWRLARCHPFGGSGFDPVPSAQNETQNVGANEE